MADLTYSIGIDAQPANQALAKFMQSIDNLSKKVAGIKTTGIDNLATRAKAATAAMSGLNSMIAGLAIGAAINNAIQYADSLQDISSASGIAIDKLMGLSDAFILSGGDAEKARASVLKFLETIDEAASGSLKMQNSFNKVGVTLNDLRTLSEEDLLRKTITGLSEIEDPAKRAALAVDMLGKGAKGIDFTNVADSLDRLTAANARNAENIRRAADFQDKLDRATITFKNSILSAIAPVLDFINALDPEEIEQFVDAVVKLGAAAAGLSLLGKAFGWISAAITTMVAASRTAMAFLTDAVAWLAGAGVAYVLVFKNGISGLAATMSAVAVRWAGFTAAFASASGIFGKVGAVITTLGVHLSKTIPYLITNFAKLIPIIGGIVSAFEPLIVMLVGVGLQAAAVAAAIIGINSAIKYAFNVDPIDTMAAKLEQLTTKYLPGLAKALNWVGEKMGMAPPPSQATQDQAKKPLPEGVKPSEAGAGRGNGMAELKERQKQIKRDVKDASDFEQRMAEMTANIQRNIALQNVDEIKAIRINAAADIAAAERQINEDVSNEKYSKERGEQLKAQKAREINSKAELDISQITKHRLDDVVRFTDELKIQSKEYGVQLGDLQKRYQFETSLIGLTDDEIEQRRALNDLATEYSGKLKDIDNQIIKLQTEQKLDPGNKQLADKIKLLQDQKIELGSFFDKAKSEMPGYITQLQTAKLLEEDRKRNLENMTKAIEAQIQRQQTLGDILVSANDKLKEAQFEGAQQKRSPLEQQMAAIQENARKAALEAGRSYSAQFEGMDLTTEQAQELANGLQQIADKYKLIADEQSKNLEYSRSWEAGWKDAFDKYMDNATNAATRAGEVFSSITRNMESAIDRFVETGKFSFKDFARSIIQDLIKIELKAQATQILKAIGGSGGIFSAIGSLFGFAEGGNPPINKPSIVGENGPELFVPKSAGTIIPNGATQGIMNGIGTGAVNAPITNNYITNNISAVDAKSVAQLFAENRKTLLGTVEMARKELPYNNR